MTKKNNSYPTTIHKMVWHNMTCYIMSNEAGTITLELYNEPCGKFNVRAYICNLWVKDGYRRKGVATELLDMAERIAKADGFNEVWLEWREVDTPRHILEWYLRKGYDDKTFGGGEVLMKKILE